MILLKDMFGIKNLSNISWKVDLPSGNQKPVPPGSLVPIKKDFVIDCTNNAKDAGKII